MLTYLAIGIKQILEYDWFIKANNQELYWVNLIILDIGLNVARAEAITNEKPQSTDRDTLEKYPKDKNKINKRESQTQYLTNFDNLPTTSR